MRIILNGEDRQINDALTVSGLLDLLQIQPQATLVERNGEIVDRARFGDTRLADGDVLELVQFVGGG